MLTKEEATKFAKEWVDAWNARDLERILSHWADDCVFTSPKIMTILGDPSCVVRGKEALRAYWKRGLDLLPNLRFEMHTVFIGYDTVVLGYRNERGVDCGEMIRLENGLAVEGRAHYVS